jgi:hypothetical protein
MQHSHEFPSSSLARMNQQHRPAHHPPEMPFRLQQCSECDPGKIFLTSKGLVT